MNRSISIKSLRPQIAGLKVGDEMSEEELFQNEVLRPILKYQNELLTALFFGGLGKREIDFSKMNIQGKLEYVTRIVQKDIGLRNVLIGSVVGMMDIDEILSYYKNETEYRRRISKMIIERLGDQLS